MEERYEFLFGLLQSSHVCKYIFDAKNSLKPFLERNRAFRPQQLRDPQIAAWVLSPESLPGFTFNQICQKYLSDTSFANYSPSANLARDIMLSMQVMATLQAQLERENLWNVYLDQEMPLVPILSLMEMDGVLFDNEQLVASERQMQEMLSDLETLANRVCGFPVALSSPKQVANVIFNKIGLRPPKNKERKIASGRESTTEAILKSMASQHPLPDIVLRYRQVSKFQSNWVSSLNRRKAQGRLFSNWSQTGASTGRIISSKPNLQNLPRASLILDSVCSDRIGSIPLEKVAPSLSLARAPPSISVRSAFVAEAGNVFVSADFSQLEMRLLAHVSQDSSLIEFFNEGKDIHALVASKWKGIPLDKITNEDRTAAKRLVYGIMYGMGPVSLADHLGVGQDVAKNFLSQFLTAYPAVQLFIERTKRLARARGWVRTLFGRRRLLNYDPNIQKDYSDFASMEDDEEDGDMEDFGWGPDDAVQAEPGITQNASSSTDSGARRHLVDVKRPDRQAVNSVIQGTAADIVKRAMLAIDEELRIGTTLQDGQFIPGVPEAKLILQIHDEILYECPEASVPRVAEIIKRNMENAVSFSVPLTVQLRMGLRWGNMKSLLVPSNDMLVSAPRVPMGFSDASYATEPPSINTSFHSSMTNSTTEAPLPSGVTTMGSTGALSADVGEGGDSRSGPDAEELFSQM
jgi:DNA polymerase-1